MNIALVTTTVYVPEVLREYRALDPDVPFIIAGDLKSPHEEIEAFCEEIGNAHYIDPGEQRDLYPDLSNAIGWNCVMRRNIAILEAKKADVIVTIDDDNAPTGDYFEEVREAFEPHSGHLALGEWFNLGELADEPYCYRGLPFKLPTSAELTMNGRPREIGVVNGLIYGEPDINATERIELHPTVSSYVPEAEEGIATDPRKTWTPINSQNTAWRSELAPLMPVLPHVGRYDDIWGSYIAQRVMMETDYHVRFGPPFVHQDRNPQDVFKNLADELYGMKNTEDFVAQLCAIEVPQGSVLEGLRAVLTGLKNSPLDLPHDFFDAWLEAWE